MLRQESDISKYFPFVVVIGGFLFSILWEAKPRYVIPYVFLMLPAVAMGIRVILLAPGAILRYIADLRDKRNGDRPSEKPAG